MTTHLQGNGAAACGTGADLADLVPLAEALTPGGRHFDCVGCHQTLTGCQRHSTPETPEEAS